MLHPDQAAMPTNITAGMCNGRAWDAKNVNRISRTVRLMIPATLLRTSR